MASTTSGTNLFSLDVDEIIEEAISQLGGEWQSGVDTAKARRTLNLILIQLSNKNIPLNKLEIVTTDLVAQQQTYTFDSSYQDILSVSISVPNSNPQSFLPIQRYGIEQWNTIPNQTTYNRPNTFMTQRLNSTVTLSLWPIPQAGLTYQARMVVAKQIEDITASYQQIDLNPRYLPAVINWLAYELGKRRPGYPPAELAMLKADYQESLNDAYEEDEERANATVKPGGISAR